MKTITLCGSLRFRAQMEQTALKLVLSGHCVLLPLFPTEGMPLTDEQRKMLGQAHKERIRRSDAIFVVDVEGYIGEATRSEIALAKELGKEIMYWSEEVWQTSI